MELKSDKFSSVRYHAIFDYKLTKQELIKWQYKNFKEVTNGIKNNSRLQREKYSRDKLIIAKRAAKLLSKIKTVKFVGITGALAMNNAGKDSDIDLIIITSHNRLWITRLLVYFVLSTKYFVLRKPRSNNEKDALCLNLWLDEQDLVWNKVDRNLYTAHEIAQVVSLVNKDKTYQKFLYLNKWILDFWPNSVRIGRYEDKVMSPDSSFLSYFLFILETFAFKIQYWYMKSKITREVVTPTRAIFHPNDWGSVVIKKLSSTNS